MRQVKLSVEGIEVTGYFHRFMQNFIEFEAGPGLYPVAIVELPNGDVVAADISSIRFVGGPPDRTNM